MLYIFKATVHQTRGLSHITALEPQIFQISKRGLGSVNSSCYSMLRHLFDGQRVKGASLARVEQQMPPYQNLTVNFWWQTVSLTTPMKITQATEITHYASVYNTARHRLLHLQPTVCIPREHKLSLAEANEQTQLTAMTLRRQLAEEQKWSFLCDNGSLTCSTVICKVIVWPDSSLNVKSS